LAEQQAAAIHLRWIQALAGLEHRIQSRWRAAVEGILQGLQAGGRKQRRRSHHHTGQGEGSRQERAQQHWGSTNTRPLS
jgi:hypothetical protein